jgi:tetratricopeptide (TPR) repeat protein
LVQLASVHMQQNRTAEAIAELEPGLAYFRQGNWYKETGQTLILLGRLKREQGDFEGARRAFEEQLEQGRRLGDVDLTGLAHEGLGSIALRQAHFAKALSHCRQRYELGKAQGSSAAMAFGLRNAGAVLILMGRFAEAEKELGQAAELAEKGRLAPLLREVTLDRAQIALYQGKVAELRALTAPLVAESGLDYQIKAKMYHGVASVMGGDRDRGFKTLEESEALARSGKRRLLLAQAQYMKAEALLAVRDARRARETALAAAATAAENHTPEQEWLALALAAKAAQAAGDPDSRELARRAEDVLRKITAAWDPADTASYLNRPDVRRLRR